MDISGTTPVYTDFRGLERLKGEARTDRDAALRKAASHFEALFLQMMLKSMRDAGLAEGIFDSQQMKTYRQLFDKQVALEMSESQGLGLAEAIVRQLGQGVSTSGEVQRPQDRLESTPTARTKDSAWRPASAEAFVQDVLPHAQRAARELDVRPEVLVAQAALETGWGQGVPARSDNTSSYNVFGIKADSRWTGDRVSVPTLEYRDGVTERTRAEFRAYDSLAEGFADYVDFVRSSPRYAAALRADDSRGYVQGLQAGGYATDPQYAEKVLSILEGDRLSRALKV